MIRIDNELQKVDGCEILSSEMIYAMLHRILPREFLPSLENKLDLDCAFCFREYSRFRLNVFHQYRGISAAFRNIPLKVPSLEQLNLPEVFYRLCDRQNGLILITGPTGSGKSTTLAAMIDYINSTQFAHILTIEDPIEYIHESKKSLVQQREVSVHAESFSSALRAALREDPDYILVGEMRDLETMRLALTAAETGHLVLATLHTNSAAGTINRIIDVFPSGEKELIRGMIASSLQAVISQVLLKRMSGGRVAAHEILLSTPAVRNLIGENKVGQIYSVIQTGQDKGMRTLDQSLHELRLREIIDKNEYQYYLKKT